MLLIQVTSKGVTNIGTIKGVTNIGNIKAYQFS